MPKVLCKSHYSYSPLEMGVSNGAATHKAYGPQELYNKRSRISFSPERFQIEQKWASYNGGPLQIPLQ